MKKSESAKILKINFFINYSAYEGKNLNLLEKFILIYRKY